MKHIPVNPAALPTPSGYSHGTLAGNTLHLACMEHTKNLFYDRKKKACCN